MPRALLGLVLLALIPLSTGCSSYLPPTIELADISITDRSDEAWVVGVRVDMTNPNSEPLELLTFDYEFSLDGRVVFRGRRAAEATLSSRGTKTLALPSVLRFDRIDAAAARELEGRSWSMRGSLIYVTPGEIAELLLDTGVRKPTVNFAGRGTFPDDLPDVSARADAR